MRSFDEIGISVIVPIYNSDQYLNDCLNSLINQQYTKFEIICVDDCGTDTSMEIAQQFAQQDPRFKILRHSSNLGMGPARNAGLDHAKGKYVFFLDSDDFLHPAALEHLYSTAEADKADVVIAKTNVFADGDDDELKLRAAGHAVYLSYTAFSCFQVSSDNWTESISKISCVAWGKLFLRSFLENNRLRFISQNIVHEDNGFQLKLLSCFPLVSAIDAEAVYYRIRRTSLMSKVEEKGQEKKRVDNLKIVLNDTFDYVKLHNDADVYERFVKSVMQSPDYKCLNESQNPVAMVFAKILSKCKRIIKRVNTCVRKV
ncbi:glycosyltransferase family 2 protein [Desulfovibrio sp. QI0434]